MILISYSSQSLSEEVIVITNPWP